MKARSPIGESERTRRPKPETATERTCISWRAVATYELEHMEADESGLAFVALSGELDLTNADDLVERLDELANGDTPVVLDLSRLVFIDSAAIHCLFRVARERGPRGVAFVVEPTAPVAATLEIVELRPSRHRRGHVRRGEGAPRTSLDVPRSEVFCTLRAGTSDAWRRRQPAHRKESDMGISLSIFLIAVGAILAWAVNAEVSGIDVQVAGIILVVVGVIGLIASLVFWSSWGGFGNREGGCRRRPEHDHRRARPQLGARKADAWESSVGSCSGFLAGVIAKAILPGVEGVGIILTTLVGIGGALLGGFLATALGLGDPIDEFFDLSTWVAAVVGALIILYLWNVIRGRRIA